jgi:hypothetical protein
MRRKDDTTHDRVTRETHDRAAELARRWNATSKMELYAAVIALAYRFETFEQFEAACLAALGESPGKE